MRSYYARVEHKIVVGVDVVNFLATTSLILLHPTIPLSKKRLVEASEMTRSTPTTNCVLLVH